MNLPGGYNVNLAGRPSKRIELLPEPEMLYLPRRSRRFTFAETVVENRRRVRPGQILARDPTNYSLPLLSPRAGTVRLDAVENHIVLENITKDAEEPYCPDEDLPHIPRASGSTGIKRYKLLCLGGWEFMEDALTGDLPDPFGAPEAVIVSTIHMEPYVARGDLQIEKRLASFTRGLEHLQSLLEYQAIYLVLPAIESDFGARVKESIRGYAWVKTVEVQRRYGLDHPAVIARALGLGKQGVVWAVGVAGVLAIDRVLTLARPCTIRFISFGGPAVTSPTHLVAMPGYPLRKILEHRVGDGPVRTIAGGALTGASIPDTQLGLDVECRGLTVLHEATRRQFLGFARPGWDRRSYGNCFASVFRRRFHERFTTALRGERRPCVSCGACDEVCPARIMPQIIHKLLYRDALEDVEQARADLCVRCGLCSYVCPSKLELRDELVTAQQRIRQELHVEEKPS